MKLSPAVSDALAVRLLDRRGGHRKAVLAAYAAAIARDSATPGEMATYRSAALRRILEAATNGAARWRGVELSTSSGPVSGLRQLPAMSRQQIQSDPASFESTEGMVSATDSTGGSTGTPMRFKVDRSTQIGREASLMWADSLAGWRPGERIAMLWGSDRDVQIAHRSLRGRLRLFIENRRWYNAFDMGPDQMAEYHRAMTVFQPHVITAYAGSIDLYARWLEESGLRPTYPAKAIISSAELLVPEMRQRIERVFQKPVFNRYGNREFGAIAAECSARHGLHVNESDCYVEVLSEDPYNIPGPLLVTYFHNFVMPFIRYDTGDLAVLCPPGRCSCGRETMRIARIVGRQSDTIRTRSGRWIHGEYFTHLFYGVDAVRSFQFVQETLDEYELRLEADPAACRSREAAWIAAIREAVGAEARVSVTYVDAIPLTASGKRKFTISHVSPAG